MTDEIDEAIAAGLTRGMKTVGNGKAEVTAAIRTTLRERGYEIVPRDPTEAMLKAFGASDIRCNCEECATIAWAAMVSASPDRDEVK